MTGDLKAYVAYKDSGVEWLGEIPAHWMVVRAKALEGNASSVVQTGPFGAQLHAADYVDDGVPLVLIRNVKNDWIDDTAIPRISREDAERLSVYRLEVDDIVFSRVGSIGRIALCTDREAGWVISGQMLRVRIRNARLTSTFAAYAFGSSALLTFVELQSVGSTRESINTDILRNMPIPLPPLPEQRAISAFLDRETGRIDALIALKERQIELLQEKRAALISHAVTRGLDPDVPMKDSGVEWLGEIPAHWKLMRLRRLIEGDLVNGLFKKKEHFGSGVRLLNVFDAYRDDFRVNTESLDRVEADHAEQQRYAIRAGDVFFVRSSLKLEGVGRSVCALDVAEPMVFECHLVRARPDQATISPEFLINFLNSAWARNRLIALSEMVTMATIGQDRIKDLKVPVPPLTEQSDITDVLDRETERIDALVAKVQSSVETLHEYRTALISAAVTGKIDVRQEAPACTTPT